MVLLINAISFRRSALTAQGIVIASRAVVDSEDGSTTYRPEAEFKTPDGLEHRFVGCTGSNPPAFKVGEAVEILYDAASPTKRPSTRSSNSFFCHSSSAGWASFSLSSGGFHST